MAKEAADAEAAAEAAAKAKDASDELCSTPQVFECTQPHPVVAYRYSPKFADKNPDGKGPKSTHESGAPLQKCVVGSDFVKSSEGITFMKCSTGRGWLPLHNKSGSINCFKHLGEHGVLMKTACDSNQLIQPPKQPPQQPPQLHPTTPPL